MNALILYPMLTTALYYLGARAKITRFLWSRYPKWLDSFMLCAACSGFWYGLGVGFLFGADLPWAGGPEWNFLGLPVTSYATPVFVGLCSMVWTPVLAYIHDYAMRGLGSLDDVVAEATLEATPSTTADVPTRPFAVPLPLPAPPDDVHHG